MRNIINFYQWTVLNPLILPIVIGLPIHGSPMHASPVHGSLMHDTPMHGSHMHGTLYALSPYAL